VLHSVTVAPTPLQSVVSAPKIVLTEADGVPNTRAATFDKLQTVPKGNLGDRITRLTTRKMREAGTAVSFALGSDDE
jgi:mRNA-degrading endonuclease toxin of MazEF toxin-antitoxin module